MCPHRLRLSKFMDLVVDEKNFANIPKMFKQMLEEEGKG
jgi:hypothetical protein